MVKSVFVNGTVVTPEFLNAINNPTFVDTPQNDGEIPKITNSVMSLTPGNILPEWIAFRDALLVSAGTGLTVTYTGGSIMLPTNTIQTITPGVLALADNSTNYVYVNSSGAVVTSTALGLISYPMAIVTTVSGVISGAIQDIRPKIRILPRANILKIFGGIGGQGDYTLNTGTDTFGQSEYYFNNLTIGAAATLNITQGAVIYCSGTVTIQGTVTVSPTSGSGGKSTGFSLASGAERAGNNGFGYGGGGRSAGGGTYLYSVQRSGSGGAAGVVVATAANDAGTQSSGGDGAGFVYIEAANAINVSGTIQARGGNGTAGSASNGSPGMGGGGGGSGGSIFLKSATSVIVSGTLDVRGGNGGNAVGTNAGGGGPGGGGVIAILAPSINTTGSTTNLSAGSAGTTNGAGSPATGGGGGGFGGSGGTNAISGTTGSLILRTFLPIA